MLAAVPHRHTHRGPFSPEPLPAGLLPRLQHDAIAEGATLVLVDERSRARLRDVVEAAARWQQRNPMIRDELRNWTRGRDSDSRDGVPAHAYIAQAGRGNPRPAGTARSRPAISIRGAVKASSKPTRCRPRRPPSWSLRETRRPTGCGPGRR